LCSRLTPLLVPAPTRSPLRTPPWRVPADNAGYHASAARGRWYMVALPGYVARPFGTATRPKEGAEIIASSPWIASTVTGRKFIFGEPMKPATKALAGLL